MNILELLKRFRKGREKVLGAGATLYPDKIVIETIDRIKDLYGIVSPDVTIVAPDTESNTLGRAIRVHLNLSRDNLRRNTDTEKRYKKYLKAAGFNDIKSHYKNALHLTIHQKDGVISIAPTKNGGPTGKNRGFLNTNESPLVVAATISDSELGELVRSGWSKCLCMYPSTIQRALK